ncbi:MAG: adenine phosphoribosyltransferase [Parasphingopyxis sp.]|nr:adenine phosphoribosyltransferase [Sphingomonadales bacterium]
MSGNDDLKALIRTIPDFPTQGIAFRDITTLLLDAEGFAKSIDRLAALASGDIDLVAAIEARGFVFGAAVAKALGVGLVLVRKPGKLPGGKRSVDYALEYGSDSLEMHDDAIRGDQNVLLIDDLIATGGTACAALGMLREAGARVTQALFVVNLPDLGGAERLEAEGIMVGSLVEFEGE